MDSKKIELNQEQFLQLMKLVYLGRWMANSFRDDPDKSLEELEQHVFSFASTYGHNDMVDYDMHDNKFFPSIELEDTMDHIIRDYDDYTFWDELAWRMAERDFVRKFDHAKVLCMTSKEIVREKNIFADKYIEEFNTNGIDNLLLTK